MSPQGKGDGKPKDLHYMTADTSEEIEFLYLDADAASHSDPTHRDAQAEFRSSAMRFSL